MYHHLHLVIPLLLIALFSPPSLAQQYEGGNSVTGLPSVKGAEVVSFNIAGQNGRRTSLINYFSYPNSARPDPKSIQRLIIILTGSNRDAWNYFQDVHNALPNANELLPEVSEGSVAILAPWWSNTQDFPSGANDILVWEGTGWSGGDNNVFPQDQANISAFEVMDQILLHYDNKSIYPNLKHMVVAGHSRGAQMAHRYAAVGKVLPLRSGLSYWIGNPNSFLWFNGDRPRSIDSCPIYNDWREGLQAYRNTYENSFVNARGGNNAVHARYNSRNIGIARGLNDHGNSNDDCKPLTQGKDRGERFYNYISYYHPSSSGTVDYVPNIGHDSANMMKHEGGLHRLFIDNWDGRGHRRADVGPRQVAGDNPHPNDT